MKRRIKIPGVALVLMFFVLIVVGLAVYSSRAKAGQLSRGLVAAIAVAKQGVPLSSYVSYSQWLVRCTSIPVSATEGIQVTPRSTPTWRVKSWYLIKDGHHGSLTCFVMGQYPGGSGNYVSYCIGPTVMAAPMLAAPECDTLRTWPQVAGMFAAFKDWIADQSTCCGEATRGGDTYRAWPCNDVTFTVVTLDGYGPGIVAGTDPCADYVSP